MDRYTATIIHHSIARARTVEVGNSINAAKRNARAEFGGEFNDYLICIYDRDHRDGSEAVATKRVDARNWWVA